MRVALVAAAIFVLTLVASCGGRAELTPATAPSATPPSHFASWRECCHPHNYFAFYCHCHPDKDFASYCEGHHFASYPAARCYGGYCNSLDYYR